MDTLNSVSWIREIVIKKYGKIGIMDIKLLATWIQKLWGHGKKISIMDTLKLVTKIQNSRYHEHKIVGIMNTRFLASWIRKNCYHLYVKFGIMDTDNLVPRILAIWYQGYG